MSNTKKTTNTDKKVSKKTTTKIEKKVANSKKEEITIEPCKNFIRSIIKFNLENELNKNPYRRENTAINIIDEMIEHINPELKENKEKREIIVKQFVNRYMDKNITFDLNKKIKKSDKIIKNRDIKEYAEMLDDLIDSCIYSIGGIINILTEMGEVIDNKYLEETNVTVLYNVISKLINIVSEKNRTKLGGQINKLGKLEKPKNFISPEIEIENYLRKLFKEYEKSSESLQKNNSIREFHNKPLR